MKRNSEKAQFRNVSINDRKLALWSLILHFLLDYGEISRNAGHTVDQSIHLLMNHSDLKQPVMIP